MGMGEADGPQWSVRGDGGSAEPRLARRWGRAGVLRRERRSGVSGRSAVAGSEKVRAGRTLEKEKLLVQQAFWTEAAAVMAEGEADISDLEFSSWSDYGNSRTSDENKETKNNNWLGRRIHTSSF